MEQFIDLSKQTLAPIYCANYNCNHRIVDVEYGKGTKKCEKCGCYTTYERLDGVTKTYLSIKKRNK